MGVLLLRGASILRFVEHMPAQVRGATYTEQERMLQAGG